MATPLIMLGPGGDYVSRYFVKGTGLAKQVGRSFSTQADTESSSGFSDWQERHGAKSGTTGDEEFSDFIVKPRRADGFEHVEPVETPATYRRAVGAGRPAVAMAKIAAVAKRVVAQHQGRAAARTGDAAAVPGEPSIAVLAVAEQFLAAQQRVIQSVASSGADARSADARGVDARDVDARGVDACGAGAGLDSAVEPSRLSMKCDIPHYAMPESAGADSFEDAGTRYVPPRLTACGAGVIELSPAAAMCVAAAHRQAQSPAIAAALRGTPTLGIAESAIREHDLNPGCEPEPLCVATTLEPSDEHPEPHPETTENPDPHSRRTHRQWLFANDAGTGGQTQRLQGHRVRARGGAHQKGRAGARSAQGSLFNS